MFEELIELTSSVEFEEYGTFDLVNVRLEGGELILQLNVFAGESDEYEVWEIECLRVLEHTISMGQCERIELSANHVLLWNYLHPQVSVSFHGEVDDALAVVGALYNRHVELVGHWISFDRFLNGDPVKMIQGRFGMLAEGPLPLIQAYAEVLDSYGIGAQVTEPKPPSYTNDEESNLAELTAMILSGRCFVVAEKFSARRLRDEEV